MSLGEWTLPRRIRNRNLKWVAIRASAFALFFLWLDLVSGFGLGVVLGLVLFLVPAATAVAYFVSWKSDVLEVRIDGISIEGFRTKRSLLWSDIDRFTICEPAHRSLMMLTFRSWADQAAVVLCDGSTIKLRAVQPWHGFTIIGNVAVGSTTDIDHLIGRLNRLRERDGSPR
jgi:hypothetical protein